MTDHYPQFPVPADWPQRFERDEWYILSAKPRSVAEVMFEMLSLDRELNVRLMPRQLLLEFKAANEQAKKVAVTVTKDREHPFR